MRPQLEGPGPWYRVPRGHLQGLAWAVPSPLQPNPTSHPHKVSVLHASVPWLPPPHSAAPSGPAPPQSPSLALCFSLPRPPLWPGTPRGRDLSLSILHCPSHPQPSAGTW